VTGLSIIFAPPPNRSRAGTCYDTSFLSVVIWPAAAHASQGVEERRIDTAPMGITLCTKSIELHGGKIWVTSQVGAGSTFTFAIPVRRGE